MSIPNFIARNDVLFDTFYPLTHLKNWVHYARRRGHYSRVRQGLGRYVISTVRDIKMKLDLESYHDMEMFLLFSEGKLYESALTMILSGHLSTGMTFVDVGANNGYFSLMASKMVGPNGTVISVEPSPANYSRLLVNKDINSLTNVRTYNVAMSNNRGFDTMHFGIDDGQDTLVLPRRQKKSQVVQTTTLDTLLAGTQPDFIKIDVEGYEPEVIEGGNYVLSKSNKLVLSVEYNKQIIRERKLDYDLIFKKLLALGFSIKEMKDGNTVSTELASKSEIHSHREMTTWFANLLCYKSDYVHF